MLMSVGCGPRLDSGFDSPESGARIYAITQAAEQRDRSAATMRHLVAILDSDDPAERMLAIRALERITGETHEYRYYDDALNRAEAVDRWLVWLEAEGLTETEPMLHNAEDQTEATPDVRGGAASTQ